MRWKCCNCTKRLVCRPRGRGLCYRCWHTPGVLERFPITSKFATKPTEEVEYAPVRMPPEPTTALPGTLAKMAVMMERASKRMILFHPEDRVLSVA